MTLMSKYKILHTSKHITPSPYTEVDPMNCPTCQSTDITYNGEIAAPGYGKSYSCRSCGANLRVVGKSIQDYADIDPSDLDMDPWDCI